MAIEESLVQLKEDLQKRGYEVVDIREGRQVDAIIYYDEGQQQKGDGGGMLHSEFNSGGIGKPTFLVNAFNRDVEEIHGMLQRRSYSPLFTGFQ